MAYQALYREYRPQTFEEVVGQDHITRTLCNAVKTGRISHAYLFCGPRGTGKTSTARILAKAINCTSGPEKAPCNSCDACVRIKHGHFMDLIEIDAATHTQVDKIRDVIVDKAALAPAEGRFRVYVVDEVHMLSTSSFNALLKTLEEPPAHVIFILATTEVHKLPATILSRCQRFDFRRVSPQQILNCLEKIQTNKGFHIETAALSLIAAAGEGSVRDAISILDQVAGFSDSTISLDDVNQVLGRIDIHLLGEFAQLLFDKDIGGLLERVETVLNQGKDIGQLLVDLSGYFRNLLLISTGCHLEEIEMMPKSIRDELTKRAKSFGARRLIEMIETLCQAEKDLRWNMQHRLVLEMVLVKLTQDSITIPVVREVPQGTPTPSVAPEPPSPVSARAPIKKLAAEPRAKKMAVPSPTAHELVGLQSVIDQWTEVMKQVKAKNISTYALLQSAQPEAFDNGTVLLGFEHQFHKDKIEEAGGKHKQILLEVFKQVFSDPCSFSCRMSERPASPKSEVASVSSPSPSSSEPATDIVDFAKDLFGATVVSDEKK